ncbi:MAG: STAS domain-containing protein [Acidobacteriaceae bacterium]|nr:STAS domain-containing protein [Acidobacteriaceae bacterium]MBV9779772.1 STAS domain-containing protein [Acidobacteriaceae bacterium]
MALEITEREVEGITLLELHGRLVAGADAAELRQRVTQELEAGHKSIILDLQHVHFIDSSGLGTLVVAHTQATRAGGGVKLLRPSRRNIQLLILTKLSTIFEIFDDEQAAINSFFPDRERKPFDILEFVKSQPDETQHLGAEPLPEPKPEP